jgi:hypothetical protein
MGVRGIGKKLAAAVLVVGAVGGIATTTPAAAEDPVFVEWSGLLPSMSDSFDPGSENDCNSGKLKCVDAVIKEMDKRFKPLLAACSHNAMFSLTYLRTTERYRISVSDPHYFSDNAFVNHQDAVFARYYFDAWDDYRHGRLTQVSTAWQIAFDAADRQTVSGVGNLMLGMSAHVNRDLPFVLAGIGLVKPDGSSRKPDHDKVNQFLNQVIEPLFAEASARLDPTVDDASMPGTTLDETATLQILVAWREQAWRNAERLANAATPAARAQVALDIENFAALEAQALVANYAYAPLSGGAASRNAYCATHKYSY